MLEPEIVRPSAIAERLLPDAVHQGLYLETDPLPSPAVESGAPESPDERPLAQRDAE